jgi:peptide/nickel transport system ATP-binding protein
MQDGFLVEEGERDDILKNPKQEYTRRLTEAVPVPDPAEQAERRRIRLASKK